MSETASDALARSLAEAENLSDEVAGLPEQDVDEDVADILLDLVRRETTAFSTTFSGLVIEALRSGGIEVNSNPARSAGFRVLKAPDVPSVLFEMGYLTNAEDEKRLLDTKWRDRMVEQMAGAIIDYAGSHGMRDTAGGG